MSSSDNVGNGVRASGNVINNNGANNSGVGAGSQNYGPGAGSQNNGPGAGTQNYGLNNGPGAGSQYNGPGAGSQYNGPGAGSQYNGPGAGSQYHGPGARSNNVGRVTSKVNIGTGAGGTNSGAYSGSVNSWTGGRGTESAPIETENSHASIHGSTKLAAAKVDPPCSMTKDIRSSPRVTSKLFQTVESNEQTDLTREELQSVTTSLPRPVAPAQADSLVIEIDDDALESEVFAQLDHLDDFLEIERSMPPNSEDRIVEEEKNNSNIPSQESINAATHLLLELLNGNPSELCQVIDQKEAFNAAEILSKAPTLDASVRMFWSDFPTIFKNFSQRFINEEKVVSDASAAAYLAQQHKEAVEKKKSTYDKVRTALNTQTKRLQDTLDEIAKLEARLTELRKATTEEKDNLKSLGAERSKLLVELKEEGREALAAKSEVARKEGKAKEATNTLQQMRDEWASWTQHLC